MNVVVNGAALPGDGEGETDIEMVFGEIEMDVFSLVQLAELTGTEDCAHKVYVFDLNSDQKHRYGATGIAVVQYRVDNGVDRIYFLDHVIDGPFLYMLCIGEKLKAFHCENCARDFVEFFVGSQPVWRRKYHGALRISAPTPEKSYQ